MDPDSVGGVLRLAVWIPFITICLGMHGCNQIPTGTAPLKPQWVNFNTANSKLSDNHINALFVDGDGNVWAATANGASSFRNGSWGSIIDPLSWSYTSWIYDSLWNKVPVIHTVCTVTSVAQTPSGELWFGLSGGGVARYNTKSPSYPVWTRYTYSDYGLVYDVVQSVAAVPPRGDIWIATIDGVAHFIPGSLGGGIWQSHSTDSAQVPQLIASTLAVSPLDNRLWLGDEYVLVCYDGQAKWTNYRVSSPCFLPVTCIAFDASNTIWVGKCDGASSFDATIGWWKQDYAPGNTDGHFPQGPVNAVLTDYSTTRWFGTTRGLVRLSDTTWTTFNRANTPQLPSDTITALAYDMNWNLWIGTVNGIAVYNETGTRF